jgi:hypothetical protein
MKKQDYKTQEYNWNVIENRVSPYSLVQNNNVYPVPLWAKVGLVVGVLSLVFFMGVSLL